MDGILLARVTFTVFCVLVFFVVVVGVCRSQYDDAALRVVDDDDRPAER